MLQEFENHIKTEFPGLEKKKVLLAISGGVDSVVLAYLLKKLNYEFSLAHCNFKLRGKESDLDEDFIKKLAKKINIETHTTSFNTKEYAKKNKESIQIAARNLRYEWFDKISVEKNIDHIITAHHLDDNLETFLINLTRGMGIEGLTGIPERNKKVIRPLLSFSRLEIVEYAKNNNIQWREDASNKDVKYTRNKIRHQVIPVLKEINPNVLKRFEKMLAHTKQGKSIIEDRIKEIKQDVIVQEENEVKINIKKILNLSNPRAYLYYLLKEYGFTEWNNVFDLLISETGKKLYSNTHILLKNRDYLILKGKEEYLADSPVFKVGLGEVKIQGNLVVRIENTDKNKVDSKNCILVNKNLVTFPMIIRKWEQGDIFYPTGMLGKKKVSKFFKDEKLSEFQKKEIWLLCNNDNEVIWVISMRQDRRFSILDNTSLGSILRISI